MIYIGLYSTLGYDKVWTLPSYEHSIQWQHSMWRSLIYLAPFTWNSVFFDQMALVQNVERKLYTPRGLKKTVTTFETNTLVVKNAIIPLAIMEHFYRQHPEVLTTIKIVPIFVIWLYLLICI